MMKSDSVRNTPFLERYEFIIPFILFALFLLFTLPGISWGAPSIWHPDEVVYIAMRALYEGVEFDASNFNHPHLPIFAMFWLGKILVALGQTGKEVLIGARVLSAVLTGFTVVLAYLIPRRMGYNIYVSALSALLLLSVSAMSHNARFAHNDTFVTFFCTLTIFFLVQYITRGYRGWLYAAFFASGMAVSSKYIAITLVLVPIIVFLWTKGKAALKLSLDTFETLFIGGALTYLGYAIGTPKALTWMAFYFKRLIPALIYNSNYGVQPDSVRGIFGQYSVFLDGVGVFLFILFIASFIWGVYKVLWAYRAKSLNVGRYRVLLLFAILVLDLPIMASYNYPTRFFLPLMPFFAILSTLFIGDLYALARQNGNPLYSKLIEVGLTYIILISLARSASVMLLFINDARIPATKFVASLPASASLEHTEYPPGIPENHFEREHNYPIYFRNTPDEPLLTSKNYVYNSGEAGLNERQTTYLVIDSFTSDKFNSTYTCELMQIECDFFKQLAAGESAHYKLIADFSYKLPPFLPRLEISFVNPQIRIYERIP
ncbi:MAG: phospholipid carrier-dependent glycosyltransferase [Anaerolineae bacterium]|nr:phospholipid carrier-dependent glycosyltransferase [Anaerolineae bacterium]MCI0611343.1 phospholipid carrier-dependent glycosyltransferase [Anaerolineae bacterium]